MARVGQQELTFSTWGGRRRGAGRPAAARPRVRHLARSEHRAAHPVLVTMRSLFRPLRHSFVFRTLSMAIADANRRRVDEFRVVHFSVQVDHLHLIVESEDKRALSSGMRSLAIRIARSLNRLVGRRGKVWADRWHGRELRTPREVRVAIAYVLCNFRKHHPQVADAVDRFSSAPFFSGFRELEGHALVDRERPDPLDSRTESARTWLLRVGWLRHGLLSLFEIPGGQKHRTQ